MTREWTPERRAAQAGRIRATKPWLKSTGPKTAAGKKRSSLNALKHGERCNGARELRKALRLNREFRRIALALYANGDAFRVQRERTIKKIIEKQMLEDERNFRCDGELKEFREESLAKPPATDYR